MEPSFSSPLIQPKYLLYGDEAYGDEAYGDEGEGNGKP